MSVTLELKTPTDEGIFYRYAVCGCTFWFTRAVCGNIYSVSIRVPEDHPTLGGMELYARCPEDNSVRGKFYPTEFYIRYSPKMGIINIPNAKKYASKIMAASAVLEEIEAFFASHDFCDETDEEKPSELTLEQFAAQLNHRQYGKEVTKDDISLAKKLGYLIVFGYSDDLIEFRGAINDEADCYEGGTIHFTKDGICDEPKCFDARPLGPKQMGCTAKCAFVEAIWCPPDLACSWRYETDLPYEEFDIYEDDDDLYCRGMVIDISSLGGEQ